MSDNKENASIQEFIRVIFADWFSRMSGGLSIPFVALGAFNVGNQKDLFYTLAIMSLGVTAWRLWARGYSKIRDLNKEIDELRNPPKTPCGLLLEFLQRKYDQGQALANNDNIKSDDLKAWCIKINEALKIAYGGHITNDHIQMALSAMYSMISHLISYPTGDQSELKKMIAARITQIPLIIEAIRPYELSKSFDPRDLSRYE